MGQVAGLSFELVYLLVAIQFVLSSSASLNSTSKPVADGDFETTTPTVNVTLRTGGRDNLAELLRIMQESVCEDEQYEETNHKAKVLASTANSTKSSTPNNANNSATGERFERLVIGPDERRRVLIGDQIYIKRELKLLSANMSIGFDKCSKEHQEIHWVVMHNKTTILAVRSATKYHYWELEQTVSSVIIFVMIVVGNLSILFKLKGSTKRRRSNVNYFIVQLARADLLVGLVNVTLDLFLRKHKTFPWGLAACRANKYFSALFIYSSINVLVALSYDRWEVIVKPMNISRNRARGFHLVAAAWLVAFVCASPVLFFSEIQEIEGKPQCWIHLTNFGWRIYMLYMEFLILVLPLISITICYTQIVCTIWRKGQFLIKSANESAAGGSTLAGATSSANARNEPLKMAGDSAARSLGPTTHPRQVTGDCKGQLLGQTPHIAAKYRRQVAVDSLESRFSLDSNGQINGDAEHNNYIIRRLDADSSLAAGAQVERPAIQSLAGRANREGARNRETGDNLLAGCEDERVAIFSPVTCAPASGHLVNGTTTNETKAASSTRGQVNETLEGSSGGGGGDGSSSSSSGSGSISPTATGRCADGHALSDDHYAGSGGCLGGETDSVELAIGEHKRNATIKTIAPTMRRLESRLERRRPNDDYDGDDDDDEEAEAEAGGQPAGSSTAAPPTIAERHSEGHPVAPSGSGVCVLGAGETTGSFSRKTSGCLAPTSASKLCETGAKNYSTPNYVTQASANATQQHGSGVIPKARIKTIKMTLVIVAAYILCWFPFCVFNFLSVFGFLTETNFTSALVINAIGTLTQSLTHLNSAVNPIIFWMFSSKRASDADTKRRQRAGCLARLGWLGCCKLAASECRDELTNCHQQHQNNKTNGRFGQQLPVGSSKNNSNSNNNNNNQISCVAHNNQRKSAAANTRTTPAATSLAACRSFKHPQNHQRFSIRIRSLDADLEARRAQGQMVHEGQSKEFYGDQQGRSLQRKSWPVRLLDRLARPFNFMNSNSKLEQQTNNKQRERRATGSCEDKETTETTATNLRSLADKRKDSKTTIFNSTSRATSITANDSIAATSITRPG